MGAAYNRVGGVLEGQGDLKEAGAAFAEDLAIRRRLAEQDPANTVLQRELAASHIRVGGVLAARGDLRAAGAAFAETLAIGRRLDEQDPSKSARQRELATA